MNEDEYLDTLMEDRLSQANFFNWDDALGSYDDWDDSDEFDDSEWDDGAFDD